MTDKEIKKASECCGNNVLFEHCVDCPFDNVSKAICTIRLSMVALDFINRLEAENERLTIRLRKVEHQLDDAMKMYNIIKAEARKEFAERLKKHERYATDVFDHTKMVVVRVEDIEKVLEETE